MSKLQCFRSSLQCQGSGQGAAPSFPGTFTTGYRSAGQILKANCKSFSASLIWKPLKKFQWTCAPHHTRVVVKMGIHSYFRIISCGVLWNKKKPGERSLKADWELLVWLSAQDAMDAALFHVRINWPCKLAKTGTAKALWLLCHVPNPHMKPPERRERMSVFMGKQGISRQPNFRVSFQKSAKPCLPLTTLFREEFRTSSAIILFLLHISLYLSPSSKLFDLFSPFSPKFHFPDTFFQSTLLFPIHDEDAAGDEWT